MFLEPPGHLRTLIPEGHLYAHIYHDGDLLLAWHCQVYLRCRGSWIVDRSIDSDVAMTRTGAILAARKIAKNYRRDRRHEVFPLST